MREYLGRFKPAFSHRDPPLGETSLLETLRALQKQVTHRQRVEFTYENLRGEETRRKVDPHLIHGHEGNLYLLGHCHLRGDDRIFRVDCMRDLALLDEDYQTTTAHDPGRLLRTSLGVHLGTAEHAVIRFTGTAARYHRRSPLHPDQTVLEDGDDTLVVRVPIRGRNEILETVLRSGAEAELLEPAELRETIVAVASQVAERHARDPDLG